MKVMPINAFVLAQRFVGLKETPGLKSTPFILGMLTLDSSWVEDDETPWCSAFVNFICWMLRLPRSKSLAARSWLQVGEAIDLNDAVVGFDVVVLKRGGQDQPGPDTIAAPGHVGFFAGRTDGMVHVLGGNQGDQVSIAAYPTERILGVRRLTA